MALNHMVLQGRTVADVVAGQTPSGVDYANFRLAWNEKYKEKETKCFIDCKAFSGTARFIGQYMKAKGTEMIVEGKLTTEEWENDGQKRSKNVLLVSNVHFCGKRQDGGTSGSGDVIPNMTPVNVDGELPF